MLHCLIKITKNAESTWIKSQRSCSHVRRAGFFCFLTFTLHLIFSRLLCLCRAPTVFPPKTKKFFKLQCQSYLPWKVLPDLLWSSPKPLSCFLSSLGHFLLHFSK